MARKTRKGYTVSLTEQEKARVDRVLEINSRNGRQQFMAMIDAELKKVDPQFLKDNRGIPE